MVSSPRLELQVNLIKLSNQRLTPRGQLDFFVQSNPPYVSIFPLN